jgi:hypothetical protein
MVQEKQIVLYANRVVKPIIGAKSAYSIVVTDRVADGKRVLNSYHGGHRKR